MAPIHFGLDSVLATLRRVDSRDWKLLILIADVHLTLSHGLTLAEAEHRGAYYQAYLRNCFGKHARFVSGTEIQSRPDYLLALLEACNRMPLARAKSALPSRPAAEGNRSALMVASVLYPLMQCLDAVSLGTRVVVADQGQRKIYSLMESMLPGSEYKRARQPRLITVPTGVDIMGRPLKESRGETRITLHETESSLASKMRAMYAPPAAQPSVPGRVNALLWYIRYSVFPWISQPLRVHGQDGAEYLFHDAASFEQAYSVGAIHPADAKQVLEQVLWQRITQAKRNIGPELCSWIRT